MYGSISNLKGLEHFTNLTYLKINGGSKLDISALSNLTNLEKLNLGYNTNLPNSQRSVLGNLTKLVELNISANGTLNSNQLSFIKSLTNLKILDLYNDSITDISFLEGLTSLEYLTLDTNSISDLIPLESLTNLKLLSLANNSGIRTSTYANLPITTEGYVLVTDSDVDLTQYTTEHTFYEIRLEKLPNFWQFFVN